MELLVNLISWILLLTGGFFVLISGIGALRFPDYYTRIHAAGITDTLGAGSILIGLMLQAGLTQVSIKLGLILFFMVFTGPVAAHVLAKAALSSGHKPLLHEKDNVTNNTNREETPSNT
jgi:multicomponent Na+:H+ antiporter subunit G